MLKENIIKHSFHGEIESLGGSNLTMTTTWVEGIEILAFIAVIYFIFYSMNKHLFKKDASEPKQMLVQKPHRPIAGGMVGAHTKKVD